MPTRKVIVITGASDGIGASAARQLKTRGHRVVLVGRSPAKTEALARATQWGLAIRLAQRLSGGVAQPLEATSIAPVERDLVLSLEPSSAGLKGEAVARRLKTLAQAMDLSPRIDPVG